MIYHYRTEDGRTVTHEQSLHAPESPPREIVLEDGAVAKRVWGKVSTTSSACWPMECEASGVHPDQADQLRDEFKRLGMKVEVSKEGNPIYTSPAHRRRALKARGFHDRNSYV